ncbi:MAG: hypothetical protein ACFFCS_04380, partial [Candidatus Hodarchaeota archaeon]
MGYGKNQVQLQVSPEKIGDDEEIPVVGEFEEVNSNIKKFKINKHLAVVLNNRNAYIEVNGIRFRQCLYPVLTREFFEEDQGYAYETNTIDKESLEKRSKQKSEDSVDGQLWARYGTLDHPGWDEGERHFDDSLLTAEQRFWAICSSLQVWAENGYSTKFLHAELAFPLALALANLGDTEAKEAYENEVLSRWKSGFSTVQTFLIQRGFINNLSSKTVVKILACGMPAHSRGNWANRVDERALFEAWKESRAEMQYKIMTNLRNKIEIANSRYQALMLTKSRSIKIARQLLETIDQSKFNTEDLKIIKTSKLARKALENINN